MSLEISESFSSLEKDKNIDNDKYVSNYNNSKKSRGAQAEIKI